MLVPLRGHRLHLGRDVLVFDLDGTLVDSAPDLDRALGLLLAEEGRRPVSLSETRSMIGDGVDRLVARALARTGSPVALPEQAGLVARFLAHYSAGRHALTLPYPGVVETLAALQGRGLRLAVCTNKPIAQTREVLSALDLARWFGAVTGGDSAPTRKPDPGHLLATLDLLGAAPAAAVMVGDSANDVEVARAAGVPVVVVSYGYTSVRPADLGADAVIDSFADLLAWLDS